jgi:hypothetical protein
MITVSIAREEDRYLNLSSATLFERVTALLLNKIIASIVSLYTCLKGLSHQIINALK